MNYEAYLELKINYTHSLKKLFCVTRSKAEYNLTNTKRALNEMLTDSQNLLFNNTLPWSVMYFTNKPQVEHNERVEKNMNNET